MHSPSVWFPASLSNIAAVSLLQVLSLCRFAFCPIICPRNPTCAPYIFQDISDKKTQVSTPKINTACTTSQYNISDTRGSAPSLLSSFPSRLQTRRALPTFRRTAGQSSSDRSNIRPGYLKLYTP